MTPPNLSIVLIMVCFWVTLWLVHRYLIQPIGRVLDERRTRIDGAAAAWSSKHEEYLSATARLEAEMEEAARAAAAARNARVQQAQEERQRRLAEARERADGRLESVLSELAADAEKARRELHDAAQGLARSLAARLLEREV